MPTPKEIDKELSDRLYELLMIKKQNEGTVVKGLSVAINKVKASMREDSIAWVEKLVNEA